jgi:hypothetical protein
MIIDTFNFKDKSCLYSGIASSLLNPFGKIVQYFAPVIATVPLQFSSQATISVTTSTTPLTFTAFASNVVNGGFTIFNGTSISIAVKTNADTAYVTLLSGGSMSLPGISNTNQVSVANVTGAVAQNVAGVIYTI